MTSNIHRLNYASEASDSLSMFSSHMSANGAPAAAAMAALFNDYLRSVPIFLLPDNGIIFESKTEVEAEDLELFLPPYPVFAIEFECNVEMTAVNVGYQRWEAPKRLALVFDLRNDDVVKALNSANCTPLAANVTGTPGGVLVWPIDRIPEEQKEEVGIKHVDWMPSWAGAVIPLHQETVRRPLSYLSDDEVYAPLLSNSVSGRKIVSLIRYDPYPFGEVGLMAMDDPDCSQSEIRRKLITDTSIEIVSAVSLCMAMNCSNVSTQVHRAPEKLNKKRRVSNKSPLFDYHVLDIPAPHPEGGHSTAHQARLPVRTHVRRGHIRRLPKKLVWVNSTVVGKHSA